MISLPFMLSLLSGAVTIFAFAPFGWWQIQIAALALLFILVQRAKSAKAAFRVGWAFATAAIAAGTHWLYISLHDYGGMPSWLASLAVFLLGQFGAVIWSGASARKAHHDYSAMADDAVATHALLLATGRLDARLDFHRVPLAGHRLCTHQ